MAIISDLILIQSTNSAYLFETIDNQKFWIPKSQVDNISFGKNLDHSETGMPCKEVIDLEIPDWIARQENLI